MHSSKAFVFAVLFTACGARNDPALLVDSGVADSGATGPDAGPTDLDAGVADGGAVASDAGRPDAGVAGVDAGTPIIVAPDAWSWVPVEGSKCASGTPTGIGFRHRPSSRRALIYLQGGGSCSQADNCWVNPTATNLNGYGATDFAKEPLLQQLFYFDVSSGTQNPFADETLVFVPYCTGDAHSGTAVRDLGQPTYFNGANNLRLALGRLAATLPGLERVTLVGTSAGGAGTTINYERVKAAFNTRVDVINDSQANIDDPKDLGLFDVWGADLPSGCSGCDSRSTLHAYNRSLDPNSRYAYLSFRWDSTYAPGVDLSATSWVTSTLAGDDKARWFIVDNPSSTPIHVVSTKNRADLKSAVLGFARAMTSDGAWTNQTFTP